MVQLLHFMLYMSIKKNPKPFGLGFWVRSLAVPYFRMGVHTIIGAGRFHFRGRDGIGWFPPAMAARQFVAGLSTGFPRGPALPRAGPVAAPRRDSHAAPGQSPGRGCQFKAKIQARLREAPLRLRAALAGRLGVIWPSLTGN